MLRKTLIAAAAAAMLGAIGSLATTAPAQAMPLSHALHAKAQADLSMVTPVHSKKKRYRKRYGGYQKRRYGGYQKRYQYRQRPSVSFSFGLAPGFYIGSGYHPRFRVHSAAPHHCHSWRSQYGHRQRTCHRHY